MLLRQVPLMRRINSHGRHRSKGLMDPLTKAELSTSISNSLLSIPWNLRSWPSLLWFTIVTSTRAVTFASTYLKTHGNLRWQFIRFFSLSNRCCLTRILMTLWAQESPTCTSWIEISTTLTHEPRHRNTPWTRMLSHQSEAIRHAYETID